MMLVGMGLLAAACAGLALAPGLLANGLSQAVSATGLTASQPVTGGELRLRLSGISTSLDPLWVVAALLLAAVAAAGVVRALRRRTRRRRARLWDCGGGAPSARMAYTATSFAEPLQRVFDDVLAPEQDLDITPVRESAYLVERVRYQHRVPDRIEHRLYRPVLTALDRVGARSRLLANGSIHLYLGYGLFGLVALLGVLAVHQ